MKLNEIKERTNLTTEEILNILPQPDPNCPFIDSYVEDIEKHLVNVHVDKKTHDLLLELRSSLEEIRSRFELLRTWGQDWKDVAKLMMEEYDVNYISENVYKILNDE